MALLVTAALAARTPTTVTYRFGPGPDRTSGSVVIDTATLQPRGPLHGHAAWVVRAVLDRYDETGSWPARTTLAA